MFVFNNDIFADCDIPSASPLPSSPRDKTEIKINYYDALQFSVLSIGVLILLRLSLLHLCTHVSYVTFNTDLNLYSKKKTLLVSPQCIITYLSLIILGLLLLSECEKEQIVLFIIRIYPNIGNVVDLSPKTGFRRRILSGAK